MSVFDWMTRFFSSRDKALSLYKRGMARARKRNHQGAIDDYTATFEMAGVPAELRAMVLYNRALVLVATGDNQKGAADLEVVLAMDDAPVNVRTMARQKLAKMESRLRKIRA